MKGAIKAIEEELLLTPWNLTRNFVLASHGRIALQLTGLGDPSGGRGEGFSFLRQPQKTLNPRAKEERDLGPKMVVTGTEADLRKLTLDQINKILYNMGVTDEEMAGKTRWNKVAMIRSLSSQAKLEGHNDGVTRFARNLRVNMAISQQQLDEKVRLLFVRFDLNSCKIFG